MTALKPALTADETTTLANCERTIAAGMKTFVEVGTALATVRNSRLYRATHSTFEGYCTDRWQLERSAAYRLIEASGVVSAIADTGAETLPSNVGQTRELAKAPAAERTQLWSRTVVETNGNPTAAAVRAIRERTTLVDRATGEIVEPEPDLAATIAAADEASPVTAERARSATWNAQFAEAILRLGPLTSFAPADVAANADEANVRELHTVLDRFTEYVARVDAALAPGPNVIRMEARR